MKPKIVDEILAADKAPPEAAFDNAADMLAHLNDAPSSVSTTAQDATALADIADEIEQSDGLLLMLTGGPRQLGIKRSAMVVAALRATSQTPDAVRETRMLDTLIARADFARKTLEGLQFAGPRFTCVECKGQPVIGHDEMCAVGRAIRLLSIDALYAHPQPQQADGRGAVIEATQAQHGNLTKGQPAQFVRNGILETCQCRECIALQQSLATDGPAK